MAFDEHLAGRIRAVLARRRGVAERKMFGGVAFLANGKMFCGVVGRDLMVRVGPAAYAESLARRHVREMDFTGRPMKGLVYVGAAGIRTDAEVRAWVDRGLAFVRSLPSK